MVARYPCRSCLRNVNENHNGIFCNSCKTWIHSKCNLLTKADYNLISSKGEDEPFICLCCIKENLPFSSLNNNNFNIAVTKGVNYHFDEYESELTQLTTDQINYVNKFKAALSRSKNDDDEDSENSIHPHDCNYYNPNEFSEAKFDQNRSFSVLHLNIASIEMHIEELRTMLLLLNFKFDIIAISESKVKLNKVPSVDINIDGYNTPFACPSEACKGGVLLYVSSMHFAIPRPDLGIYMAKNIESTFVEIINSNSKNTIVGVVYKHPTLEKNIFNEIYLDELTNKLFKEKNKNIFIAGDFNFNLLNADNDNDVHEFLEIMTSHFLLPSISLPTRIAGRSKTLIDNIFTNSVNPDTKSGNLLIGISDHLPSFVIVPKANQNHLPKKHNLYTRDTKKIDVHSLLTDLQSSKF